MKTTPFKSTPLYAKAIQAVETLKQSGADRASVQAIAEVLMYMAEAPAPERTFPYVGDPSDPRDQAIVEAHEAALQRFMQGDDEDDESEGGFYGGGNYASVRTGGW